MLSQIKISTNFVDPNCAFVHLLFLWFVCIGIKQYYKYGSTTKHGNYQIKCSIYKKCHRKNRNLNNLDKNSFLFPVAVIFHL